MGLKELKEKNQAETSIQVKNENLIPEPENSQEKKVIKLGTLKGDGFIVHYTGPERNVKGRRHINEFPNRLPLEPLSEEDKQGKKFYVKPLKFKSAQLLLEMKEDESNFNERQKKWREDVITSEDLRQEVGKYRKSNNRLGLHRYIFVNDVIYSINGLLYYLVPLIISIIALIIDISLFSLPENVIVATCAILPVSAVVAILKSKKHIIIKFALFIIVFILTASIIFNIKYYFPEFWSNVNLFYSLKIFLIYFGVMWFGRYYVIWHIMYVQDLLSDFGNVFKVKGGKPRVGKTSQGIQEAKALALVKWRELQYDYWKWHSREDEIIARGNTNELLEWYAIKESYEFYTRKPEPGEPQGIPCLWSNIGISDAGKRMSYEVTLDHIRGLSRLPLYSVVFFDEIGAVLKSELSLKKGEFYDVSDMFRLGGQYLKWCVIACEQDPKNIYIDCRRVAGANELVKSQQWVCKPLLALAVFSFLKACKIDRLDRGSKRQKRWSKFMIWFEGFVKSIGFRRQIVSSMGNLETGAEQYSVNDMGERIPLGKNRVRYVASAINKYYDDRAYKSLYPSYFSKKIYGKPFKSKSINGLDIDKATQFVSKTDALQELRSCQKIKIKEIT